MNESFELTLTIHLIVQFTVNFRCVFDIQKEALNLLQDITWIY